MLKVEDLGFKRDRWILRGVNLNFEKGKIYGVIGRSGSGKTSLLKMMAGLLGTTEGKIFFEGKLLIGPAEKLIPGYDDIQLVNQDFDLEPYHTVEQNVREKILSRHEEDQDKLIDEFLELVELDHVREQKANSLSGGEKQRLAIARALACEPKVLLLDEPFVHLDQRLRWKILNYLRRLISDLETTVILVSHDGAEVMGFAENIIYIANGEIKRSCSVNELYYQPESKVEAEILGEINCVEFKGKKVLFRPNEYKLDDFGSLKVKFLYGIDIGITYFNYFQTVNSEIILLSSRESLEGVERIRINKRNELE